MEEDKYMIPIPGNIKLRMEVINGVGIKEIIQTIVAGIIGAIIGIILNAIFGNYLVSIGIFLGITGITFIITMKDKNNTSIADLISWVIDFYKKQRYFKYVIDITENGGK